MKNNIFLYLFVCFASDLFSFARTKVPYYCSVVLPTSVIENKGCFIASYKGEWHTAVPDASSGISPLKSLFEIYEDIAVKSIHILVTEQPQLPTSLDVKWKTSAEHPYRLFLCEAKSVELITPLVDLQTTGSFASAIVAKEGRFISEWQIHELDNSKPDIDIPDNTLIFFFDPAVIDIKSTFFDENFPFRILPTIFIRDQLSSAEFKEKINKMACMSMDCKPFNKRPSKLVLPGSGANSTTIVSLPAPTKSFGISA